VCPAHGFRHRIRSVPFSFYAPPVTVLRPGAALDARAVGERRDVMARSRTLSLFTFLSAVLLLPAPTHAQSNSGIAGIVRDTSGAVLPGVTVEAASPALMYNLFNANPVLALNNTFGPQWQRPTQILQGRLLKFGVQVDF
jgi:hypothetical protein